jgi:hypothetical protein
LAINEHKKSLKNLQTYRNLTPKAKPDTNLKVLQSLGSKSKFRKAIIKFSTGLLFGISIAVGLGLNFLACVVFGVIAGISVLICGSLVSYVLLQTLSLAVIAGMSRLAFSLNGSISLEPAMFQTLHLAVVCTTPLLIFIPKVKNALSSLSISNSVQFFASALFLALSLFLRSRLPSDPEFGLSKMYFGEDNGGIISHLSFLLNVGYSTPVSHYGEFINGLYFAAAGLIGSFGGNSNPGLLSALTHFNMTFMFMAWLPIAAMLSLALTGRKLSKSSSAIVILVMASVLGMLFWPFAPLGHTGVMSAGLLGVTLLSLALNQKLFVEKPILFATLISVLAFLTGTSWIPLMPFSAAVVAITFAGLLTVEYKKGNQRLAVGLASFFTLLAVFLLPSILSLVARSGEYLKLPGGSRSASHTLVVAWAALLVTVLFLVARRYQAKNPSNVAVLVSFFVIFALITSNLYLSIAGLIGNSGQLGYGATKYLLTTISFSLPVLWLVIVSSIKPIRVLSLFVLGLGVIALVLLAQPDSRRVPLTILVPSVGALEFLDANQLEYLESPNRDVIKAITLAVAKDPDHIVCASDFGFPAPGGEENYESYACNRWSRSLIGDETPAEWAILPLDMTTKSALNNALKRYEGKKVVLLRITKPLGSTSSPQELSKTWWIDYVDESWEIITVR